MSIYPSQASSILLILLLCAMATSSAMDKALRYSVVSEKPFEEAVEDLKFAITEQNFRITSLSKIGQAIAKREGIPFSRVTVIHFCNLSLAQEILELELDYALYMPCRIAIHERGRRTLIQPYFLPEDDPRLGIMGNKINLILKNIVDYAAWD